MLQTSQLRVLLQHTLRSILSGVLSVFVILAAIASVMHLLPLQQAPVAQAASAKTLNFQARLLTGAGSIVPDGNYNVEFKLYNADTSTGSSQGACTGDAACLWTETRTGANQVEVKSGYLNVYLGDVTDLPSDVWTQQLWLTMNIGGTGAASWDGEMNPRLRLTAVPVAYSLTNYNAATGFSSSLSLSGATGGDQTFTIPDQGAAGAFTLLTTQAAAGEFIQNQNTADQTADFRITGVGRADTALQAPLLDTAGAAALNIGTTNATAINLNQDTTISSGNGLTVAGGATSLTGVAAGGGTALAVTTGASDNVGISVTGVAGQTEPLIEVNSNSATVFRVKSNGAVVVGSDVGQAALYVNNDMAGAGAPALVVRGDLAQSADLLQLTDSSGNVNANFNNTGNQLTLGRIDTSGTVTPGVLRFADGTTNGHSVTIESSTLSQDRRFLWPDTLGTTASPGTICVYNGAASNCPAATGSTAYIWNSNTVQDASNYYIRSADAGYVGAVIEGASGQTADLLNLNSYDGTTSSTVARFTAAGNLEVAGAVDTFTAANLNIGTANATGITLGQTGVATTNAGALTVNQLLTGQLGANLFGATVNLNDSSNFDTNINTGNSTGAVNIGGGSAGSISLQSGNAGSINLTTNNAALGTIVETAIDSTNGFVIRNSSGNNALRVDTTSNFIYTDTIVSNSLVTPVGGSHYYNGYWGGTDVHYLGNGALFDWTTDGNTLSLLGAAPGAAGAIATASEVKILEVGNDGSFAFTNRVNSGTALRVADSSNTTLLNVDTINQAVINNGSSSLDNQLQNPSFEYGVNTGAPTYGSGVTGWRANATGSVQTDVANAHSGDRVFHVTAPGDYTTTAYYAVQPGDIIYYEGYVKTDGAGNGGFFIEALDKDKANPVYSTDDWTGVTNTYAAKANTYTVPSGVFYIRVGMTARSGATGNWYFDDLYMRKSSVRAPMTFQADITANANLTLTDGSAFLNGPSAGGGTALTVATGAANNTGLVIQNSTGQSSSMIEGLDGNGDPIFKVKSNSAVTIGRDFGPAGLSVNGATVGANTVGIIVKADTAQTADLFQLWDSSNTVNAAFNEFGNQLTLGHIAGSGAVTQGLLRFSDGTNSGFGATLQAATLTADRTLTLPDASGIICVQGDTSCGFAAGTAADYIQNQNAAAQAADFFISGTGQVGGNFTVNGTTLLQPSVNAQNALEMLTSSGEKVFSVDTASNRVKVGAYTLGSGTTGQLEVTPIEDTRSGVRIRGFSPTYSGNYLEVLSSGASTADVLRLQSNGNLQIGGGSYGTFYTSAPATNSTGVLLTSGDVTGAGSDSGSAIVQSGDSNTGSTGSVTIRSGNAANGSSGSITIDPGTGNGSTGQINIGTANASAVNIGSGVIGAVNLQSGNAGSINMTTNNAALGTVVQTATNSANGFVVRNSGGTDALRVDTTNDFTYASTLVADSLVTPVLGTQYFNGYWNGTETRYLGNGAMFNWTNDGDTLSLLGAAPGSAGALAPTEAKILEVGNDGSFAFTNRLNSGVALRVADNSGNTVLSVDTANHAVINNANDNLDNELQNPGFEYGENAGAPGYGSGVTGWRADANGNIQTDAANARSGNRVFRITSPGDYATTAYYAVQPGDIIYYEGYVKTDGAGSGGFFVQGLDKDKANPVYSSDNWAGVTGAYTAKANTYTVPAGVYYIRMSVTARSGATGNWYFDDLYMRKSSVRAPMTFQADVTANANLTVGGSTNLQGQATFSSSGATQVFNAGSGCPSCSVTGVDTYSSIAVDADVVGLSINVPAPASPVVGRLLYLTAVDGSSDFNIVLAGTNISIAMKANSTATLIWNGAGWTAAGASSSTDLQSAYNNTLTSAGGAELILNAAGGAADGLTIRNNDVTPITGGLLEVQSSIGTNLFSVNNNTVEYAVNGGVEDAVFNGWASIGSTVTRESNLPNVATGRSSVSVGVTAANQGARDNLSTALPAGNYVVSFAAKLGGGLASQTLNMYYSANGTAQTAPCESSLPGSGYASTNDFTITNDWTKVSCFITVPSGASASNAILIYETDFPSGSNTFYIDNLSVISNADDVTPANVQIGGGATGGQPTIFTLDQFAGPPMGPGNNAFLGSMYYDTTKGTIQCYQESGWGACGSAPDQIITLTPEYTGAVLNGTGVGTMIADFCGNGAGLNINTSLCASVGEARNYYRWTSPQPTSQTYSIYVAYRLPSTFKQFVPGTTSLTGQVNHASNAGVSYSIYRKAESGGLTSCSASADVINGGPINNWITTAPTTDPANCSDLQANDTVIFKITTTARSGAYAYIENLTFRYSNK